MESGVHLSYHEFFGLTQLIYDCRDGFPQQEKRYMGKSHGYLQSLIRDKWVILSYMLIHEEPGKSLRIRIEMDKNMNRVQG